MSIILGLSAFYHDSAAAIINNEEIIAAAQEEGFTRMKNDAKFPTNSVKYVLVIENYLLTKEEQDIKSVKEYKIIHKFYS